MIDFFKRFVTGGNNRATIVLSNKFLKFALVKDMKWTSDFIRRLRSNSARVSSNQHYFIIARMHFQAFLNAKRNFRQVNG